MRFLLLAGIVVLGAAGAAGADGRCRIGGDAGPAECDLTAGVLGLSSPVPTGVVADVEWDGRVCLGLTFGPGVVYAAPSGPCTPGLQ